VTDAELITRLGQALAGLLSGLDNPPGRAEIFEGLCHKARAALALLDGRQRERRCHALVDVAPPAYSRTGGRVIGLFWREEDAGAEAERQMGRGDGADCRVVVIDAPHWMPEAVVTTD
jgi:hypothetical protein